MKKISIVSSCYNEEQNIFELYTRVKAQMEKFKEKYDYEQILVDNCSTDNSAEVLKDLAQQDKNVKVILNSRNFGHIKSPYWAIINGSGDAIIYLASDLQDPPELIEEFIKKWEEGEKMVLGAKNNSEENPLVFFIRQVFYWILGMIADDDTILIKNCTGFGLYDKKIIDICRSIDDPYPYFRGLICDIGFDKKIINFKQPQRKKGETKNNFYTMYDNAMLGIVKHSKVPLRFMTFTGFFFAFFSMCFALIYLIYKLIYWSNFQLGMAPLVIGLFFLGSIQLLSLGILGEYVGAIYTRVNKKPIIIEKERINF